VTALHVRRGLEPCLPALPLSVRTLTLDAGYGCAGCEHDRRRGFTVQSSFAA